MEPSAKSPSFSPCLSLAKRDLRDSARLQRAAWLSNRARWVELRLDLATVGIPADTLNLEEMVLSLARFSHRIAVCHNAHGGREASTRMGILGRAVAAGCDAVDIDWEEEHDYPAAFYHALAQRRVKRIRSLHLNAPLASPRALRDLITKMRKAHPYLVKIVVPCGSEAQVRTLLSCYDKKKGLLLIASGRVGRASRAMATAAGAPYTYVHLGQPTGPGQMSLPQYRAALKKMRNNTSHL